MSVGLFIKQTFDKKEDSEGVTVKVCFYRLLLFGLYRQSGDMSLTVGGCPARRRH